MSNQHAIQRIIIDITNDDERIQVTGYVKNQIDNEFIILNDKTGEIKVNLSNIDNFNFKIDDLINIIGDLELQTDGEKLLIADIIQDMNKLNFSYYQKLYQIKKDLM